MAYENIVFAIIAIIVVVVLLLIFFRIWELVKPYVVIAKKIIAVIDIIKNFTIEIAITLLNLIKSVIAGVFRLFTFDDTNVIALNSIPHNIDDRLDEDTLNNLVSSGKRIVIAAIGRTANTAITFANQLSKKLAPVSLVLFDGEYNRKIHNRVHVINITSEDMNVSARGSEDMSVLNVSQSQNGRVEYTIAKPESDEIDAYIASLQNGFL